MNASSQRIFNGGLNTDFTENVRGPRLLPISKLQCRVNVSLLAEAAANSNIDVGRDSLEFSNHVPVPSFR